VSSGRPAGKPRRLPWWAVGTAAAAVLAVGNGLQLRPGQPSGLPEGFPVEAPAEPVATPVPAPSPQELALPPPPPPPAPPAEFAAPPASAPPADDIARRQAIESAKARARQAMDQQLEAKAAEREAAARTSRDTPGRIEAAGPRPPEPPASATAPVPVRAEAGAPAPVAGAAPEEPAERSDEAAVADALPAVLPPVDEDARLYPESWIERIRERVRQGDRAGARASLLRYQAMYPRHEIPADLAPLLQ
jgi:hypothetical protein